MKKLTTRFARGTLLRPEIPCFAGQADTPKSWFDTSPPSLDLPSRNRGVYFGHGIPVGKINATFVFSSLCLRVSSRTRRVVNLHFDCLVLALVLLAGCVSAEPFYFVQISDTHWGARDGASLTQRAAEMINSLPVKVEFVVITGDVCSDSILKKTVVQEGLEALKGLKAPLYYVPGNHDIVKTDIVRTSAQFEKTFGPLNQKVEVRGVTCLFLCTEMREGETRPPAEVERQWLEENLKSGKSRKPVLIFMHRPPIFDMVNGSDGQVAWDHPYDTRWQALFDEHPEIKGVFAGHFHREELRWIGAVPVFVAPALARFWDRQPSFRLFEYANGQLNYWALYPERGTRR